jgi:hypothetical protein
MMEEEIIQEVEKKPPEVIARCTPLRPHGMVSGWWSMCMENLLWINSVARVPFQVRDMEGNHVDMSRNQLASEVLKWDIRVGKGGTKYILWVDDDVLIYSPGLLFQMESTMKEHSADAVMGVYCIKAPGVQPMIFDGPHAGPTLFVPDQIRETWGGHMGLTLIKLEVYRRMLEELQLPLDESGLHSEFYKTTWMRPEHFKVDEQGFCDIGHTEDFHFWHNFHRLGLKVMVDMTEHAFGFHYDAEKNIGWPARQWQQFGQGKPLSFTVNGQEVHWQTSRDH